MQFIALKINEIAPMTNTGKIIVIGAANAGKSQLINRFINSDFNADPKSTVGVSMYSKQLHTQEGDVNCTIWDTAGEEKTNSLAMIYYKNAQCAIVVFDLADQESFDQVEFWVKQVRKTAGCPVVVCANKTDLAAVISQQDVESLGEQFDAVVAKTSALTGQGVDEMFEAAAKLAVDNQKKNKVENLERLAVEVQREPSKKKNCC